MGTPAFAVPTLEKIVEAGHEVAGVFTQPDRPKGRGNQLAAPPVKEAALRLGLPVYQPARIRQPEAVEQIRQMAPEAIIVVGYGQIIPKSILEIPPSGIINVHASLLPKYRGAAPIQWAIANGEKRTGVTTMMINEGLDTGDILLKWETDIGPQESAIDLGSRLSRAGAELLVRTLKELPHIPPVPQNDFEATLAPILKREDGKLDWNLSAEEILNRIRGFEPWPGGYGFLRGQRFQIWKAAKVNPPVAGTLAPGALLEINKRLYVGCGSGDALELLEVQMEGKKRMAATALLNGLSLHASEVLQ